MQKKSLSDKKYDRLKHLVTVVLPATIALYSAVGLALAWDNVGVVTSILGSVATWLGIVLFTNNRRWREENSDALEDLRT